ncbi:lytic transglycosylase domain-containing protein [Vibrio sp. SM6]|uniref:Lytic transglycosylase domain-containing protein n=1 Tax=Vibrio agarilyticus TaxID=2726741 RepID=A0A7X8TS06_9VIBR|nr:lytic transglycosylase domain-containing protein [Vibrio agarilyticus]NLS13740.1 lytic transglycosylase domain-containing protein [Vibrio agarilyticus]
MLTCQRIFLRDIPFAQALLFFALSLGLSAQIYAQPNAVKIEQQYATLLPHQTQIEQRLTENQSLIQYILRRLRHYQLPAQLALLPMLESSFNVDAVSPAKAGGLWQLIPETARRFDLVVNQEQDQRFDPYVSTEAALRYLHFLYHKFDRNLALTLAAYNAGEGRVWRAQHKAGNTLFSELKLPQETDRYVHRFFALIRLFGVPKQGSWPVVPSGSLPSTPMINQYQKRPALIDLSPLPPLIDL